MTGCTGVERVREGRRGKVGESAGFAETEFDPQNEKTTSAQPSLLSFCVIRKPLQPPRRFHSTRRSFGPREAASGGKKNRNKPRPLVSCLTKNLDSGKRAKTGEKQVTRSQGWLNCRPLPLPLPPRSSSSSSSALASVAGKYCRGPFIVALLMGSRYCPYD